MPSTSCDCPTLAWRVRLGTKGAPIAWDDHESLWQRAAQRLIVRVSSSSPNGHFRLSLRPHHGAPILCHLGWHDDLTVILYVAEHARAWIDRPLQRSAEWQSSSRVSVNEIPSHFMNSSVYTEPQGENVSTMDAAEMRTRSMTARNRRAATWRMRLARLAHWPQAPHSTQPLAGSASSLSTKSRNTAARLGK